MFSAINKIVDKIKINFSIRNNSNKRIIKNKNSSIYGTQIAGDHIENTNLTHKTRVDVRSIEIIKRAERSYKLAATYLDGAKDSSFEAHWYGWQNIRGKPAVWTPLGFSNNIELGDARFISISAWLNDCPDEQSSHGNLSKKECIGDKPW